MSWSSRAARLALGALLLAGAAGATLRAAEGDWGSAVRFIVVVVVVVLVRILDVPAVFTLALAAVLLPATWAGAEHWYRQVPVLDVIVHFLTAGSAGAALYFLLARARLMPDARRDAVEVRRSAPVLWVALAGVALAVVWELYEWLVEQVAPSQVRVGYTDTVVDLLAGALGSSLMGVLVVVWARSRRRRGSTL